MDSDFLRLFDEFNRLQPGPQPPGYVLEQDGPILRLAGPSPEAHDNCVLHSALDETSADAAIERQAAWFGGKGKDFEWKLYAHDRPADLATRLERHGFVAEETETVMVLSLGGPLPPRPAAAGIEARRVESRKELEGLREIRDAVYGRAPDGLIESLAAELQQASRPLSVYIAYDGQKPVSAAWLRLSEGNPFAGLWGGSTLEAYRGRGIYRLLVALRAEEAQRRGARWLSLDARSTSRPIVERLGFKALTRTTPYVWKRPRP